MPSPEFGGPDIAMLTGTRSTSEICAERRRRITDEDSRKSELANASVNAERTVMTLSSTAPLELEYEVVPITVPAHGRDASSTQQGMQLRNQLRCSETGPHMRDKLLGICVVVLLLDAYALSFDWVSDALTPKQSTIQRSKNHQPMPSTTSARYCYRVSTTQQSNRWRLQTSGQNRLVPGQMLRRLLFLVSLCANTNLPPNLQTNQLTPSYSF